MKYIFHIFPFILLFILISCGDEKNSSKKDQVSPGLFEQESEGSYRAILRPMNNQLSGFLPTGIAEIEIKSDSVIVKTLLDDDAKVIHLQSIHKGTRCPGPSDDQNSDGVIDMAEGIAASGNVLIPLDRDLNSSELGANLYPSGSDFTYTEEASLAGLEKDVRDRTGEKLNLSGRVVLIHGVSPTTKLPDTVSNDTGISPQASVPIVCGIIKRI